MEAPMLHRLPDDASRWASEWRDLSPALADGIEALAVDAARALGPAGLRAWTEGARALHGLGRGNEPVIAWLEHLPAVVRECGEDVIDDTLEAMMKIASLTSGSVIALALTNLPTAARRFGDPDLLRAYLRQLHRLAARAPRGLRPMLGVLDELLARLTLSGLARWADFGAEAYRRDLAGQARYFALETEDSRAVLQAERRGTLFVDQQRRLNLYLRAFWARDFFLRPAAADCDGFRPHVENGALFLPDAVDGVGNTDGAGVYRAMVAHMAAHLAHTPQALCDPGYAPAQRLVIGLFEDARVEAMAMRAFPGLARLWRGLHGIDVSPAAHPTVALLERLARALLNAGCGERDAGDEGGERGDDALIAGFVDRFRALSSVRGGDPGISVELGLALFEALSAGGVLPSLRVLEGLRIPYRDDNRLIWQQAAFDPSGGLASTTVGRGSRRRKVSLMEFVNEIDTETAGEDAGEVWVLDGVLYDDDGSTWNDREGREPHSEPFHYPEWDYRVQLFRPDWATVIERRAERGDAGRIERILSDHKPVVGRIRRIVDRLRPQGVKRERKLEDGDELDLNAAVDAVVALRAGQQPDTRFTLRNRIQSRDIAVVLLLDLSESTNDITAEGGKSVLDLTREATALLATAIAGIGDPFAIHGFCSDGRHDVQYRRFKDFDEDFGDDARARLAAMQGGLSTRMGAAMRHAGAVLARQRARHKLLLVLTDGEPADIDERDPQTLRHDTRKAVEGLHARGIDSYCLTLDPRADAYVERLFGAGRYTVIDHIARLPERLPTLFAGLTCR